ncbi:MAG TPA: hypothetical protein VEL28_15740 [Candidatus Binatia bacterium]|nr:hypothetical protein [Candidatus Binatia bacterium]
MASPASRLRRSCAFAIVSALLVTWVSPAAAADPATQCTSYKLGAAGKQAAGLLSCASKGAKDGSETDAECVSKANVKAADGFASADAKAGEPCQGTSATTTSRLEELTEEIAGIVVVPPGGGTCASLATRTAGKFAGALLKAESSNEKSPDAVRRQAAVEKARGSLLAGIAKAEAKDGCSGSGQAEPVRVAVEAVVATIVDCIGSDDGCTEAGGEVEEGGTITTDDENDGADAEEPVESSVESPNAGTVVIVVENVEGDAPSGYEVLGQQVDITAPDATASAPLVLTFLIDASVLPGDPMTVTMTRNGVVVGDCTGAAGVADPDPCVDSRTVLPSGDLEIVVLTSQASIWVPVTELPANGCPTAMLMSMLGDMTGADRSTELDIGWNSLTHDVDRPNDTRFALSLDCSAASPPDCDTCTITGIDPRNGNCRCANNTRTTCDQPFAADSNDCGGAICQCYMAPPMNLVRGGTPVCVIERAGSQPTGSWDVSDGAGSIGLQTYGVIYLGATQQAPCPACVGDASASDGVRGGTCSGGPSNGQPCDANGLDPTYPHPGGGATSYDCLPSVANNITGLGMPMNRTETTGHSELVATLPCSNAPGEMCACRVCSGNTSRACSTDAECAAVSAGTCSSNGFGAGGQPNSCDDFNCVVDGDTEGVCANSLQHCDGLVEEDGRAVLACNSNTDCDGYGSFAGACTVSQPNECFGDTIAADGAASPTAPKTAATFCVPPTSNAAVNTAGGLPGPGRARTEWTVSYATEP